MSRVVSTAPVAPNKAKTVQLIDEPVASGGRPCFLVARSAPWFGKISGVEGVLRWPSCRLARVFRGGDGLGRADLRGRYGSPRRSRRQQPDHDPQPERRA